MAHYSKTAKLMKLAPKDIVSVMGAKGKIQQVLVMKATPFVDGAAKMIIDVLVTVDLTNGKGEPNVFNYGEVEAVWIAETWVNMKGETVAV